jgi:WD40 repeat protein
MNIQRLGHSATLLPDGKVLVVVADVAEVYDPDTDTWHFTNGWSSIHGNPTVTLLSSGKVLIVDSGWWGDSCLLYDPSINTWNTTSCPEQERTGHTATLLSDGMVLVVGGLEGSDRTATAELYNPVTQKWTFVASMHEARIHHTAMRLPDGCVLVVGGSDTATAEIYDPVSDTWTMTAAMNAIRYHHEALLLPGGEVLVLGGTSDGNGYNPDDIWNSVEILDPTSDTLSWTSAPSMHLSRQLSRAILLPGNQVLIIGGGQYMSPSGIECCRATATTEIYDRTFSEYLARGDYLIPLATTAAPSMLN